MTNKRTASKLWIVHSIERQSVQVYKYYYERDTFRSHDFNTPTKSSMERIMSLVNFRKVEVTCQIYSRDLTLILHHPEKPEPKLDYGKYGVYLMKFGEHGFCLDTRFPALESAQSYLRAMLFMGTSEYAEGIVRNDETGDTIEKLGPHLDPDAGAPCCGEPVYVVGPGAFRCSNCGTLYTANELIQTGGVVDNDPPTQDQLYEQTHDMTAEFVELNRHPRDCNCPACDGEPVEDVSEERYLRSRGELH